MIDDKYIELMNLEIDGAISEKEREELERYLESDSEALEYFNGLKSTASLLDESEQIEPPAALPETIIESNFEKYDSADHVCLSSDRGSRRAFRWRPVFAFAAGIIAGLFLFASALLFVMRGPAGDEGLYGTIAALRDLPTERYISIDGPGIDGGIRTMRSGEAIFADLTVTSRDEVTVQVAYGEGYSFDGLRNARPSNPRISIYEKGLEIVCTGECEYIIALNIRGGTASPIEVTITSDGAVLFDERIVQESER